MENYNADNNIVGNRSGKVFAGLLIVLVGLLLLLRNLGLDLPGWLFEWHTLLLVIGLCIGVKNRFQRSGWLIMVVIGGYFTLEDALELDLDFHRVTIPLLLLLLGVYLIFKPRPNFGGKRHERWRRRFEGHHTGPFQAPGPQGDVPPAGGTANADDYLNSVNVFGGSHQAVYSKNFRGGELVAVFGGCDVNLTQADFEGKIEIDVTAIFGGCKIIVPPGWLVKSEVSAIFGGLDDKRSIQPVGDGKTRLLVIRGIALFGGVDIRNF